MMFKLLVLSLYLTPKGMINGSDEFWPRAEENLLKAFEFYFLEMLIDKNNLTNIYKKIASGDISEIDCIFRGLSNNSPAKMSYNIFASR